MLISVFMQPVNLLKSEQKYCLNEGQWLLSQISVSALIHKRRLLH